MNAWFAAGATAVLMSERGRNLLRRGLVYGVANVMNFGESVAVTATDVAHGAERVASSAGDLAGDLVGEAQQTRRGAAEKSTNSQRSKPKSAKREPAAAKP
jgi:hypothetical protein